MITKEIKRRFNGKYRTDYFGLRLVQTEGGVEGTFFQQISRKGDVQYWRELKSQNRYLIAELSREFGEELANARGHAGSLMRADILL